MGEETYHHEFRNENEESLWFLFFAVTLSDDHDVLTMSMLPAPVSSSRRQQYRKPDLGPHEFWRRVTAYISSRSRVSRLLIPLLAICLLFVFAINVYWSAVISTPYSRQPLGILDLYSAIENDVERSEAIQQLQHLIIVPGHGVWLGPGYNESSWALESYQGGNGSSSRISAFVSHIRKGYVFSDLCTIVTSSFTLYGSVELAASDEESLLVFSGYVKPMSFVNKLDSQCA